jgi:hypothetical protein
VIAACRRGEASMRMLVPAQDEVLGAEHTGGARGARAASPQPAAAAQ